MSKADLLVLGATGFTGRLIVQHLAAHPQLHAGAFSLALAGRSQEKLDALVAECELQGRARVVIVDVTSSADVERTVRGARVVINTVGPYWRWGTPVVSACVKHGTHYVDLTGEPQWVRRIVAAHDFAATKTRAVVVPCCGIDSVPSDLLVHLSARTLRAFAGPQTQLARSVGAWKIKGGAFSGGTVASLLTCIEETPREEMRSAVRDYALSPVRGAHNHIPRMLYTLPLTSPGLLGPYYFMAVVNRQVVLRTWGLRELFAQQARSASTLQAQRDAAEEARYGPDFSYEEFMVYRSAAASVVFSAVMALGAFLLTNFATARWLFRRIAPKPGEGPSEEKIQKGRLEVINVTTSTPDASKGGRTVSVRSTLRARGDPGYLVSAIIIAECGLALALNHDALPARAREGGVLTPATAFGDVLIERLKRLDDRFTIESEVIVEERK